jgi:hypothetical protein
VNHSQQPELGSGFFFFGSAENFPWLLQIKAHLNSGLCCPKWKLGRA